MLLANILVAEFIFHYCKDKTLLRVHNDIGINKKTNLVEFFNKIGLDRMDLSDPFSVSQSIEMVR
jgi:exoribonuclease R